jgi:hypothetical protein
MARELLYKAGMYLVTSKTPMGLVRRTIAASLKVASEIGSRMREQNPLGIVVIESQNGATIVGDGDTSGLESTQSMHLAEMSWA